MLTSLAARIDGRPRRTLAIVLLFVIIAGVVGGPLPGALDSAGGFAPPSSQSQVAQRLVKQVSGKEASPGIALVVRTPGGATSAASQTLIASVDHRLAAVKGVASTTAPAGVSRDGREVLVTATLSASASDANTAGAVLSAFHGDKAVDVGGAIVASRQVGQAVTSGLAFAELIAAPLLIILSILFFRGRAALMPLIAGATTVLGTFLVLTGVNQVYNLSIYALNLVIGMGLGLAVDYTLFMVTRFREELAAGASNSDAVSTTVRQAGRTVIFSAFTVACALITLTIFPQGFLKSMGMAGAATALVAALAALVVSPALLAVWGPKLAKRELGGERVAPESTRWYRFAHAVMRRPGVIAAVTAAAMLAAGIPALGANWTPASSTSVIPKSDSSRTVADTLSADFAHAGTSPIAIVVRATPAQAGAVRTLDARVRTLAGVTAVTAPRYLGSDTWELAATTPGDPTGPTAQRIVNQVRALPQAQISTLVTGDAATFVDQQAAIGSHLPVAIALLVVLTLLVLWLMTGSVLLPVKAIIMNALTVGAALSAIVVVYQHGHLTGLLQYTPNGGIEPTDFVVAAVVVFALSTDYGVFLLGRIKESRERLGAAGARDAEREAVADGLGSTGRVVTAAAILLAVAIGAFSTSSISFIQQIGVAVAVGVLLDSFVVRSLLVPSLMALLGHWNWWSPAPLRRLHARVAPAHPDPADPIAPAGMAPTV